MLYDYCVLTLPQVSFCTLDALYMWDVYVPLLSRAISFLRNKDPVRSNQIKVAGHYKGRAHIGIQELKPLQLDPVETKLIRNQCCFLHYTVPDDLPA